MMDLNTLIPKNSPLYLLASESINARGQIAGYGVQKDAPHDVHAFLATHVAALTVTATVMIRSGAGMRMTHRTPAPHPARAPKGRTLSSRKTPGSNFSNG
jgi:hypothetical protein